MKTVELRRTSPRLISRGSRVFFWESSPVKQLTGTALIESWIIEPLDVLWGLISKMAGISRREFDEYFEGLESGVAFFLTDAEELVVKPKLSTLRKKLGFQPPQSFRYFSQTELEYLKRREIFRGSAPP